MSRDLTNQVFGKLTAKRCIKTIPYERWECVCECGNVCERNLHSLLYTSYNASCDECKRTARHADPTLEEIKERAAAIRAARSCGDFNEDDPQIGRRDGRYRHPKVYKRPRFRR